MLALQPPPHSRTWPVSCPEPFLCIRLLPAWQYRCHYARVAPWPAPSPAAASRPVGQLPSPPPAAVAPPWSVAVLQSQASVPVPHRRASHYWRRLVVPVGAAGRRAAHPRASCRAVPALRGTPSLHAPCRCIGCLRRTCRICGRRHIRRTWEPPRETCAAASRCMRRKRRSAPSICAASTPRSLEPCAVSRRPGRHAGIRVDMRPVPRSRGLRVHRQRHAAVSSSQCTCGVCRRSYDLPGLRHAWSSAYRTRAPTSLPPHMCAPRWRAICVQSRPGLHMCRAVPSSGVCGPSARPDSAPPRSICDPIPPGGYRASPVATACPRGRNRT